MLRRLGRIFGKQEPKLGIEEQSPGKLVLNADDIEVSVESSYPDFIKPEPLPPITLVSPACPYCGTIQEPPPQRRRRCRDCGETIYPKTDRQRKRHLLTKTQAAAWDRDVWDSQWKELNHAFIEASKTNDWHAMKMAHFRQALMQFGRGRDHQRLAAESRKSEIRHYQSIGCERLSIMVNADDCAECLTLKDKVLTIEEALKQMPIPVKTCQNEADKNQYGGWCRCSYNPIID